MIRDIASLDQPTNTEERNARRLALGYLDEGKMLLADLSKGSYKDKMVWFSAYSKVRDSIERYSNCEGRETISLINTSNFLYVGMSPHILYLVDTKEELERLKGIMELGS